MSYHMRRYYGKVNEGFLKLDFEFDYYDNLVNLFTVWVTVEGRRDWMILFDAEVW